jgi:lipid A disaccharide synthetase
MLSKVKYLSLANLIYEDKIVDEFLQSQMTAKNLSSGVNSLLENKKRKIIIEKYNQLIEKLKTNENPYFSAARYIYD